MLTHLIGTCFGFVENSADRADINDATLLSNDQRRKGFSHAIRPIDIHGHHKLEFLRLGVDQRPNRDNTGIVHEAVEAAPVLDHRRNGGVDIRWLGHIQPHGLDVLDCAQRLKIGLFACAGINEISVRGQSIGDLAADTRAGARNEYRFLVATWQVLGISASRQGGQENERNNENAMHGSASEL